MRKYLFLLSFAVVPAFAQYQPAKFTDADRLRKIEATFPVIDSIYKQQAEAMHIPGLAYGIVVDGRLVHTGNTGYTDISSKTPVTSQSDFRIASMTKSFTAMAILKLRDEGKLKLDDPAYVYIPEMRNNRYLTKDAAPVTIRHLLTHAAGYPEDNPWGDRQLAVSDAELIAIYKKGVAFSNNPGQGYEYSNLGFATLGYIIKKVSGKTYEQYITDNLLKPLGMAHTYWEYTKVPKARLAHGYRWLDGRWVEQPLLHDGAYGAMGGLITTIEDFSKYMALHMDAWPPRDDAEKGPVKRSSIREMHYPWDVNFINRYSLNPNQPCPTVSAYAYGLRWAKDCEGRVFVGHTGGLPGFGSQWNIMPDYGVGVVCFANLTYASAGKLNNMVLDTLLKLSNIQPRKLPPSKILTQRRDELVKLLPNWANAQATGIFADNFFMDYFPDKLKAEAIAIFDKAGKVINVGEVVPENNLRGYFILTCEKGKVKVSFTLTPENPPLIQEYHIGLVE
ncbi:MULTISPECIES: serine hydrolase domain-containing protein [unclassified Mucilaginibacter]|uniref:serine hydrolase domain-containing protein n=1 Tax=unclassified Mucilaginibacter TaxID=2617802 RepID=UPI000967F07E|nr:MULTISPECIES: serine hydrolase domain-containing protein [unclassified Mucilaginibacter]OJW15014.1 MAG: serine hydrolase [Mucilaginibacter sp. 44-25]PLW90761.1 MAG: serine hydrolase [Mucilaginibacter sp.]HEK21069.1 class A beta-lactamase-related serine hydrolase [Bacteroidota bacterium]